jgi:hypothetical protein
MARLFATSSALALLALPSAAMAQGVVVTTPQAGYTVPAGTTYLQIIGTTITGNVTVPKGVSLAPGSTPNASSGSALQVSNSTLNGAIVNAGTILATSPLAQYRQTGIYFVGGSAFSNAGGAATGITNTGLIGATQSFPNTETYDTTRGVVLVQPNFGTITNAGTIVADVAVVTSGSGVIARAFGIAVRDVDARGASRLAARIPGRAAIDRPQLRGSTRTWRIQRHGFQFWSRQRGAGAKRQRPGHVLSAHLSEL